MGKKLSFKKQAGFTLIEVMVAISILGFSSLALASALIGFINLNHTREEIEIASKLVRTTLEKYQSEKIPSPGTIADLDPGSILPTTDSRISNYYKRIKLKVFADNPVVDPTNKQTDVPYVTNKLAKITIVAYLYDPVKNINTKVLKQDMTYIPY